MRGFDPTSSSASHSSMPAMVVLRVYAARRSAESELATAVEEVEVEPTKAAELEEGLGSPRERSLTQDLRVGLVKALASPPLEKSQA